VVDRDRARGIEVPTPFSVGPVDVYLLEDDPLVLIDTGPDSATALFALEAGLAKEGYSLEDIGLILLTPRSPGLRRAGGRNPGGRHRPFPCRGRMTVDLPGPSALIGCRPGEMAPRCIQA
jgi:hypothetical protein